MSERYPGGIISKTPVTPSGPYANSTAPGVWTLDQQLQFQQAGNWPTQGNADPSSFIENLFSTYLYTGNDSTQNIVNGIDLSGKGGLVWLKERTANYTDGHWLVDTLRGTNNVIKTNTTGAQLTISNSVTAFNANGFSIGANASFSSTNYASWTFRKQAKFFDVVTYTGTGSATTIAHNLGSVPGCIIVKKTSSTGQWCVYHNGLTSASYGIFLNLTDAQTNDSAIWNATNPTSTVFSVGTSSGTNASGATYVAYLFASNAGGFGSAGTDNVITCGSYTGVAYPNSLEVNVGFEPQFVIIKNSNTASGWTMWDTMRGMSVVPAANTAQSLLLVPNTSAAESNQPGIFPTATGFVVKNGLTSISSPSDKMIYIAIRRGPMATPTDATKVFIPVSQTGGGTVTTNFPVDLSISTIKVGSTNDRSVFDRLRGSSTNSYQTLYTNLTRAEEVGTGGGLGFDNNTGYVDAWNSSSYTDIYWNFRRAPSFFDEVCYTGTGAGSGSFALTHNLGVVPEMIIYRLRNATSYWEVGTNFGATTWMQTNLNVADAGATTTYANNDWFAAQPTTTTFTVGYPYYSTGTYVAYLFATCPGVSKVGSYTGNGTTQTINCGFGAGGVRFVLIKRTDSTGDWYVYDTARGMTTLTDPYLLLNSTAAEVATLGSVTTVSTGFALNSSILAAINVNAGTYIFLAIS